MNYFRLIAAASVLFGCAKTEKQIVIGASIDQTSTTAWTTWTIVGNMAVQQLNLALSGTDSAVRFKLNLGDAQQDAAVAIQRAQDAVAAGAKVVITDTSVNGVALTKLMYDADVSNDLNVPIFCVTCTSNDLNNPMVTNADAVQQATLRDADKWTYRTVNRSRDQNAVLKGIVLARGLNGDANTDGKFKLSILALNDTSGNGFAKGTTALFPGATVEKILIEGANHSLDDTTYWDGFAHRLIDNDSDCIQDLTTDPCLPGVPADGIPDALLENLNPGYNIAISQALSRAHNEVPFFHAHAFRANQISAQLGQAINGQYGVSPILADRSASGEQFTADVKAMTGAGPTLLDASMYDAVVLSALAVLKASRGMEKPEQVTGAAVRDALQQLNDKSGMAVGAGVTELKRAIQLILAGSAIDYAGASGPIDFDADGNVNMRLSLYQGEDGKFVDREIHNCISDPTCPLEP